MQVFGDRSGDGHIPEKLHPPRPNHHQIPNLARELFFGALAITQLVKVLGDVSTTHHPWQSLDPESLECHETHTRCARRHFDRNLTKTQGSQRAQR